MKDPGYSPPKKVGGKPKIQRWGRSVTFFSSGGYGVRNYEEYEKILYYSENGVLENIEIRIEKQYPYISKKYSINGELMTVFLTVSLKNTFAYDKNKKYLGQWLEKNYYSNQGIITETRN